MMDKVLEVYRTSFDFDGFEDVNPYFKRVINQLKQMNYSVFESEEFFRNEAELYKIIEERKTK